MNWLEPKASEPPPSKKARISSKPSEPVTAMSHLADSSENFYDTLPVAPEIGLDSLEHNIQGFQSPRPPTSKPTWSLPGLGFFNKKSEKQATTLDTGDFTVGRDRSILDISLHSIFDPIERDGEIQTKDSKLLQVENGSVRLINVDKGSHQAIQNAEAASSSSAESKIQEDDQSRLKQSTTQDAIFTVRDHTSIFLAKAISTAGHKLLTGEPASKIGHTNNSTYTLGQYSIANNRPSINGNLRTAYLDGEERSAVALNRNQMLMRVYTDGVSRNSFSEANETNTGPSEILPDRHNFPSTNPVEAASGEALVTKGGTGNREEAEFELDSSPIEPSSSELTTDSSSSDSDDEYEMLDVAEQARRLMQEDRGSDDGGERQDTGNVPLRTLNEKPDEVVIEPEVAIKDNMEIEELGIVETIVDNVVLIKAKTSGEYQVLETGSVLCLRDRTVLGVIAETLGRVQQPLYALRFANSSAVSEAGVSKCTTVFYVPEHSSYVFTQALKAVKGSDASNIHDEEVGDDELEFSDDEAEADYKKNLKVQKQIRRGVRGGTTTDGFSGGPRKICHENQGWEANNDSKPEEAKQIRYEEIDQDDGLYTPLNRPSNLYEMMPRADISLEARRDSYLQAGRPVRGHGDRSRGRHDRSRGGHGGARDRGERRTAANGGRPQQVLRRPDLTLPPIPKQNFSSKQGLPSAAAHSYLSIVSPSFAAQNSPYTPQRLQPTQYHGSGHPNGQSQYPFYRVQPQHTPQPEPPSQQNYYTTSQQHFTQGPLFQQQPVSQARCSDYPALSLSTQPLPPGAFVNPAFLSNQYHNSLNGHSFPRLYQGPSPHQQNSYSATER